MGLPDSEGLMHACSNYSNLSIEMFRTIVLAIERSRRPYGWSRRGEEDVDSRKIKNYSCSRESSSRAVA